VSKSGTATSPARRRRPIVFTRISFPGVWRPGNVLSFGTRPDRAYLLRVPPQDLGRWKPATPADAVHWLGACTARWWIAGGWALDLFLGAQSREHQDLDVGCLRRDLPAMLAALTSWELFEARNGQLNRLQRSAMPRADVHSLWGRPEGQSDWHLELLLDAAEGPEWVFRRNALIRRPLRELTWRGPTGLEILCPEVQLLYKAKSPRPRDVADFANAATRLTATARTWLRTSLRQMDAEHPWLARL
jgi:hypothetical protein